jgi:hypothetical protein
MKTLKVLAAMAVFSAVAVSVCLAQPPHIAEISESRRAEIERPLVPRGEKMGLLVIFHGAGTSSWNQMTDSIVEKVRQLNEVEKTFVAVAGANMEFTPEGDIVDGVAALDEAGCDTIIAVPAFIFPTSHVQFDVPSVLGVYVTAEHRAALREEGIRTVRTKTPIVLTGVLADGDLLKKYVFDQAKSISKDPVNERLLVIAHGDEGYAGLVDSMMQEPLTGVSLLGFDKVEAAYVGIGQTFVQNAKPIVEANTKDGKKTLIVGVYVGSSGKSFLERVQRYQKEASLEGLDYVASETSLGEYDETIKHILALAIEASKF